LVVTLAALVVVVLSMVRIETQVVYGTT